jgi:hypothetical protein
LAVDPKQYLWADHQCSTGSGNLTSLAHEIKPRKSPPMLNVSRFLRVVLLPVAVLAMVAGSSVSASAAELSNTTAVVAITTSVPVVVVGKVRPLSMNY